MAEDKLRSTLTDRGATYGRFIDHATLARRIIEVISGGKNFPAMEADQQHALCYIADKMARVLTGNPNHVDSWHDMAGYATLIEDRLNGTGIYAEHERLGDVHAPDCPVAQAARNPR